MDRAAHRTQRAARVLTGSEFSRGVDPQGLRRSGRRQGGGGAQRRRAGVPPDCARGALSARARALPDSRAVRALRGRPAAAQESDRLDPRLCPPGEGYPQLKQTLVLAGKETWFCRQVHEAARESGVADRIHFLRLRFRRGSAAISTTPAICSFSRLSTKASAARRWKPWRAAAPWSVRTPPRCRKWRTARPSLFDPYALDEIVRAMADLLLDRELRPRMERLGLQRAAHFSLAEDGAADAGSLSRGSRASAAPTSAGICRNHSSSMTSSPYLPHRLVVRCRLISARGQLTGFPFQDETLHYTRQLAERPQPGRRDHVGARKPRRRLGISRCLHAERPVVPGLRQ